MSEFRLIRDAFQDKADTSQSVVAFDIHDFGDDFRWGTAIAAFQVEGAVNEDGRGPSIWDTFTHKRGKIRNADHADLACDFYHRYEDDLALAAVMGFKDFRFSVSWSRILPEGVGAVNRSGIDFYNRLIDRCLALGMSPWVTLYHWDLPQALEDRGGWKNREIIEWFKEYSSLCAVEFGNRVKNWIILNEPMAVAGLGYTTGQHAPGKKGIWNFLPVAHHLALCQAEGGRVIRKLVLDAYIGTAISCSFVEPFSDSKKDLKAAKRADAIMNRFFIEPLLGISYPYDAFPFLKNIKKYMQEGDEERLQFDFDFIGLQNYFSVVIRHSYLAPVLWLQEVPGRDRNVPVTLMGWEVNPDGMYKILKQFSAYKNLPEIILTENGAAFEDVWADGEVMDKSRSTYLQEHLYAILKAKREGVVVKGYLAWSLLDNFEWAEGYTPRFGLVYVDFDTQERTIKHSGKWFSQFLKK